MLKVQLVYNRTNLKPVMVFIYGGAWYVGTSDMYPGENLALNGDVVVVSFNYRLNVSSKLPIVPIDISCSMFWV